MKRSTRIVGAAGATASLVAAAVLLSTSAGATPSNGLTSELLTRGGAGEFRIVDRDMRFSMKAGEPTDVALVKATLAPGGQTGFHQHPGRSLVIVQSGTMTTKEEQHRRCITDTVAPGEAFVHPEGSHNFINNTTEPVVFYVAYFVPEGAAPLLNDAMPPDACR